MTTREAAHSLQRYRGALASGFATAQLHHHRGHDRDGEEAEVDHRIAKALGLPDARLSVKRRGLGSKKDPTVKYAFDTGTVAGRPVYLMHMVIINERTNQTTSWRVSDARGIENTALITTAGVVPIPNELYSKECALVKTFFINTMVAYRQADDAPKK
jgi:hypothetical protein